MRIGEELLFEHPVGLELHVTFIEILLFPGPVRADLVYVLSRELDVVPPPMYPDEGEGDTGVVMLHRADVIWPLPAIC